MPHANSRALIAICAAALTIVTPRASAHPHVFAEARLEVAVGADGVVEELRHVWRFDELFSSTVLLEFDANKNLILDDEEADEVAGVVSESISEFGYFQTISMGGRDIAVKPVEGLKALIQDGQLIIFFAAIPAEPVAIASSPSFGVFDPTFYTAIEFPSEDEMVLDGAPETCSRTMVVPDPDEAIAQNADKLTEAFFDDPTGNDMSKLLATRMEVSCS
jgi:ABC-type uncharacterized transport system substrate-binding protein